MNSTPPPASLWPACEGESAKENQGEPVLHISFTSNYHFIYSNLDSGSVREVVIWRPLPANGNYFIVGDYAQRNYGAPTGSSLIVTAVNDNPDNPLLKAPIRYSQIWNNMGSVGNYQGSVWQPVAPDGYVALGWVAAPGYDAPDIVNYRCLRKDIVTEASAGSLIWNNAGLATDSDVSLWNVHGVTGVFVAQGNFNTYTGLCFKPAIT